MFLQFKLVNRTIYNVYAMIKNFFFKAVNASNLTLNFINFFFTRKLYFKCKKF